MPFNHASLKLAFGDERGEELYQKLVETFGKDVKVPIMELRKKNDPDLAEVADYVYENVFLHYTMKQWGQTPDQIDPSITGRVPVFVGDDDRYFPQAPFQGMPQEGYTALFEHMLDHDLIDVFCDVDAAISLKSTRPPSRSMARSTAARLSIPVLSMSCSASTWVRCRTAHSI